MPADNSLDKETRRIDQMRPDKSNQYQIYQKSQNQLLQIQAAQKQNLMLQRAQGNALRNQNATLQQAAQLAAMSGAGGSVYQGVNPQTQATLQKYGMGKPRFQRQQSSSQQKNGQNVIIHNNTTNNTTNNVNAGGYGGPVQGRSLALKDPTIGFKTWIANTFAKQQEQAQLRDREFEKREAALTRNSNKMYRKFEGIGKTLSERFDPGKVTSDMGKQFKALMFLLGLQHLRKNWKVIISKIGEYWEGFKKFASKFGINIGGTGNGSATFDKVKNNITSNMESFGAQLIIAFGGNPRHDTIGSILEDLIIGRENGTGKHYGLWLRIKDFFKAEFSERADAIKSLDFPTTALENIMKGNNALENFAPVLKWLGNVVSVGIGGAEALRGAKFDQSQEAAEREISGNTHDRTEHFGSYLSSESSYSDRVGIKRYSFRFPGGNDTTDYVYYKDADGNIKMDDDVKNELERRHGKDAVRFIDGEPVFLNENVTTEMLDTLAKHKTMFGGIGNAFNPTITYTRNGKEVTEKLDWEKDSDLQKLLAYAPDHELAQIYKNNEHFWSNADNRRKLKETLKGHMSGNLLRFDGFANRLDVKEEYIELSPDKKYLSIGTLDGILKNKDGYLSGSGNDNQLLSKDIFGFSDGLLKNTLTGSICFTGDLVSSYSDNQKRFVKSINILQNSLKQSAELYNSDFNFAIDVDAFKFILDIANPKSTDNSNVTKRTQKVTTIIKDYSQNDFTDTKGFKAASAILDQKLKNLTGWSTLTGIIPSAGAGAAAVGAVAFFASNPIGWVAGITAFCVGAGLMNFAWKSETLAAGWAYITSPSVPGVTCEIVEVGFLNSLVKASKPIVIQDGRELCLTYLATSEVDWDEVGKSGKFKASKADPKSVIATNSTSFWSTKPGSEGRSTEAVAKYNQSYSKDDYNIVTIKYSEWKKFIQNFFSDKSSDPSSDLLEQISDSNVGSFNITDSNIGDVAKYLKSYTGNDQLDKEINTAANRISEKKNAAREKMYNRIQSTETFREKKERGFENFQKTFGKDNDSPEIRSLDSAVSHLSDIMATEKDFDGDFPITMDASDKYAKISGILGALYEQSKLNPKAEGGIAGWMGKDRERILGLLDGKYHKGKTNLGEYSLKEQLWALLKDLKDTESDGIYKTITGSNVSPMTIADALSSYVGRGFESTYLSANGNTPEAKTNWNNRVSRFKNYANALAGDWTPSNYVDNAVPEEKISLVDKAKDVAGKIYENFEDLVNKYAEEFKNKFSGITKNDDRYLSRDNFVSYGEWKKHNDGTFIDWQNEMQRLTGDDPDEMGISGGGALTDYINSGKHINSSRIYGTRAVGGNITISGDSIKEGILESMSEKKDPVSTISDDVKDIKEAIKAGSETQAQLLTNLTSSTDQVSQQVAANTQATVASASSGGSHTNVPSKQR